MKISCGRNWLMFGLRSGKDILTIVALYILLKITNGNQAALNYAIIDVVISIVFLLVMFLFDRDHN